MKKLLILWLVIFLVGCTPKYSDIQGLVTKREIPISPYVYYGDIAWLPNNTIGLVYYLKVPDAGYPSPDDILSIYDLNTNKTTVITMPKTDSTCQSEWATTLWTPEVISRSDDGNLIVITGCREFNLLLKYDIQTGELQQLFDYNKKSDGMLHFTFTSDTELVQERPVSHPMNNQLYKVSLADNSITRLLPDFLRARWPTWSLQNKLVAFWGTAQFPGKKPNGLYTFNDIETLVRAPWDLYVMDKDGNNSTLIFPLISNVGGLAWSPMGDWLAFGGTVDKVDGIWLLNINNPNPIRIFDHNKIFDWSPDGKKIIVVENKEFDAKNNDVPVKAYILELPACVFENSCK